MILLFISEGIFFVFYTPPFEAPDENHHLDYINYFANNLSLPVQNVKEQKVAGEGHQNPLYYVLTGVMVKFLNDGRGIEYKIMKNSNNSMNGGTVYHSSFFLHGKRIFNSRKDKFVFYLLRFFSLFCGAVTLFFIFKTIMLFATEYILTVLSISFAAFLPQFIFINSVISNDALSITLTSISIYFFFSVAVEKKLFSIVLALVFMGFAVLTKYYSIGFLFLFVGYFLLVIKNTKNIYFRRKYLKYFFEGFLLFVLITLPLFVRNLMLYSNILGYKVLPSTGHGLFDLSVKDIFHQFGFLFVSFYGKFGWVNVNLPFVFYLIFAVFSLLVLTFILIHREKLFKEDVNLLSLFGILIIFGEVFFYNILTVQMQGRFLFPALSFAVILIHNSLNASIKNGNVKNITAITTIFIFFLASVVSIYYQYMFYR